MYFSSLATLLMATSITVLAHPSALEERASPKANEYKNKSSKRLLNCTLYLQFSNRDLDWFI